MLIRTSAMVRHRINTVLQKYRANTSLSNKSAHLHTYSAALFKNGELNASHGDTKRYFMLASTMKVFIIAHLASILERNAINPDEKIFRVRFKLIKEVIGRYQLYHLDTSENLSVLLARFGIVSNIQKPVAIQKYLRRTYRFKRFYCSFNDLCYFSLRLSANESVKIARDYIVKHTSEVAYETALHKYIPSLEITKPMHGFDYWLQYAPNTAIIEDVAKGYDVLIRKLEQSSTSYSKSILGSLSNHDINHSFNLAYIYKRYQIYEKTGFYPLIFWIEKLADQGDPIHMVFGSLLSYTNVKQERITIAAFQTVAVQEPNKTLRNGTPDFNEQRYKVYTQKIKEEYAQIFRQMTSEFLNQHS